MPERADESHHLIIRYGPGRRRPKVDLAKPMKGSVYTHGESKALESTFGDRPWWRSPRPIPGLPRQLFKGFDAWVAFLRSVKPVVLPGGGWLCVYEKEFSGSVIYFLVLRNGRRWPAVDGWLWKKTTRINPLAKPIAPIEIGTGLRPIDQIAAILASARPRKIERSAPIKLDEFVLLEG
jgi:hypothetical protein